MLQMCVVTSIDAVSRHAALGSLAGTVKELSHLQHGVVSGLQSVRCILLAQCSLQICVVRSWQSDPREQVTGYAIEQRYVMAQELAQVHVNNGPQHEHIFIIIWEPACRTAQVSDTKVRLCAGKQSKCGPLPL